MKKVSIISGVYNAEKYLNKCIESIVNQTFKNIEIILINNASFDNSQVIIDKYIEEYPNKVIGFETSDKLGAGGSRAKGLELATGDYICFIDCDDTVCTNYIEEMMKVATKNNYPDIIYCNFQKVNERGQVKYIRKFNNEDEALLQSIAPWAKLYKKSYLENNALSFRNIPFGEDVIFSAEVLLTRPSCSVCNLVGYYWLDNPNSTSHTEIRNFPKNTVEIAGEYFSYMLEKYKGKEEYICYFMVKYFVWYLLQSGRGVSIKSMSNEYVKAFNFIEEVFPNWYKVEFNKLSYVNKDKNIIRMAICGVKLMRRLRVSKIFSKLYSKLPMEKLWPSL